MAFFAILFALLIEQVRPLAPRNPVYAGMLGWTRWVSRNFDAGRSHHGWIAWALTVLVPTGAAALLHIGLDFGLGWPLAMLWNVVVLYFTLGFRQFSHHFTAIREALDAGDEDQARAQLAQWQQVEVTDLPRSELLRHVIEYSVLAAHRHVFGVLAAYCIFAVLGLGPAGAVFYRMAEFASRYWFHHSRQHPVSDALQDAASLAWARIDWLPARITALAFAVVGSFEEAIDCWRHHAQRFPNDNDGVVLAATSGAVDVRLGGEALRSAYAAAPGPGGWPEGGAPSATSEDSESTPGREAQPAHLRSVVGLVWRSVVLWMVLLALLTLARLLG
jgi:adenosylcobinamide-phosphate synthase